MLTIEFSKSMIKKLKEDRQLLYQAQAMAREKNKDIAKSLLRCHEVIQLITDNSLGVTFKHKK